MKKLTMTLLLLCLLNPFVSYAEAWVQDSTGWQYVLDNGETLKDTWWYDVSNRRDYHFDSNGYMQTGYNNIDGEEYYFNESGVKVRNSVLPDGRATDGNGVIFNDFNDGLTYMFVAASDIQVGKCKVVVVAIKNECDKTFTVNSKSGLVNSKDGTHKKLYLYDVKEKKFYNEKRVNPNETVTLSFVASDLSEFQVSDIDYVPIMIEYNGKKIKSISSIQDGYRHHFSSQRINEL